MDATTIAKMADAIATARRRNPQARAAGLNVWSVKGGRSPTVPQRVQRGLRQCAAAIRDMAVIWIATATALAVNEGRDTPGSKWKELALIAELWAVGIVVAGSTIASLVSAIRWLAGWWSHFSG
jgi:hypothetical protein